MASFFYLTLSNCDKTVMNNPRAKDNLKPFQKGPDPRRNLDGRPISVENVMKEAATDDDKIQIAKKQVEKAKEGDLNSAAFVFGYLWGKPNQQTDVNMTGNQVITFKFT